VDEATAPNLTGLARSYPATHLQADGEAVGLMPGQMGDSNVGHLNLGAGRVVLQNLMRIHTAIARGEFFANPVLRRPMELAAGSGCRLHLLGLVSDGGVHSHEEHLYALLRLAQTTGVTSALIHVFLDGRDVPPASAHRYLERLETVTADLGLGRVATVSGRYYAMDRDRRWERTRRAFDAIILGEGAHAPSAVAAVDRAYAAGQSDEFVVPTVVGDYRGWQPGEPGIFFNFRADRARQLVRALVMPEFEPFARPEGRVPVDLTAMTEYEAGLSLSHAFPHLVVEDTLGEVVSRSGLRQLRLAETEKYAHVTFFFNGMREAPFAGEVRRLIPSPKVPTYDQKPEMSAPELTAAFTQEVESGTYDVIIMNYANLDMVGHTGDLAATRRAIKTVDDCVRQVVAVVRAAGGALLLVGDHGNAECMLDECGNPYTAHTANAVPCILIDEGRRHCRLRPGVLGNVAPSLLEVLGLNKPAAMDLGSLIMCDGERKP
jgi:2,3-bisphosphoglycerate-independent phosphoglycerate mutase